MPPDLFGMIDSLAHRGPESAGYWHDEMRSVLLMHARLSLIDLENGAQPLANEDGSVWITLNGELYDYKQALTGLQQRNHHLRSRCDAELLPHAFEETGADCFRHLRGEFAFALYNRHQHELYLVRDRFGIKPLFYAKTRDSILFASEVKGLLSHPQLHPEIDRINLRQSMLGLPLPDQSLFKGIQQVRPGHFLRVSRDGMEECPYWTMNLEPTHNLSAADAARELQAHLDDAVRARLEADVEVGAYLSGGMDSSAIAESMARQRGTPIHTFTLRFSDHPDDEAATAAETAHRLGACNHPIDAGGDRLADYFHRTVWHAESFFVNSAPIAKLILAQTCRNHVKAVLTGDGSDEMFAGYELFVHQHLIEQNRAGLDTKAQIRAMANLRSTGRAISRHTDYLDYDHIISIFGAYPYQALRALSVERALRPLMNPDFTGAHSIHDGLEQFAAALPIPTLKDLDNLKATQACHLAMYMPAFVVSTMGDRVEMGGSIEGRVPFLDGKLADWALGLPVQHLYNRTHGKLVLRNALAGRVPEVVSAQPKRQFWAPPGHDDQVIRHAARSGLFSRGTSEEIGIFNPARLALTEKAARVIPGSTGVGVRLRRILIYAASIHSLHELFVRNYDQSRRQFTVPYRKWTRQQLEQAGPMPAPVEKGPHNGMPAP